MMALLIYKSVVEYARLLVMVASHHFAGHSTWGAERRRGCM